MADKYRFKYTVDSEKRTHYRYYSANNPETAKSMFKETCNSGGLIGSEVEIKEISKKDKSEWKKIIH
jgi:hypothetical protein